MKITCPACEADLDVQKTRPAWMVTTLLYAAAILFGWSLLATLAWQSKAKDLYRASGVIQTLSSKITQHKSELKANRAECLDMLNEAKTANSNVTIVAMQLKAREALLQETAVTVSNKWQEVKAALAQSQTIEIPVTPQPSLVSIPTANTDPEVRTQSIDAKVVRDDGTYATVSWRVAIENTTDSVIRRRVDFRFLDKDGFLLEWDSAYNQELHPGRNVVSETAIMELRQWRNTASFESIVRR